jgi:hypothetical protein
MYSGGEVESLDNGIYCRQMNVVGLTSKVDLVAFLVGSMIDARSERSFVMKSELPAARKLLKQQS